MSGLMCRRSIGTEGGWCMDDGMYIAGIFMFVLFGIYNPRALRLHHTLTLTTTLPKCPPLKRYCSALSASSNFQTRSTTG